MSFQFQRIIIDREEHVNNLSLSKYYSSTINQLDHANAKLWNWNCPSLHDNAAAWSWWDIARDADPSGMKLLLLSIMLSILLWGGWRIQTADEEGGIGGVDVWTMQQQGNTQQQNNKN